MYFVREYDRISIQNINNMNLSSPEWMNECNITWDRISLSHVTLPCTVSLQLHNKDKISKNWTFTSDFYQQLCS
jgi:hypothetical protein